MRDYGKVYSTFWTSETTKQLSETGKLMALYLLTCSHSNICGAFRLPDGYVSEDLDWSFERVSEGFSELFRKGFINRCETTKWVFISRHFDWNKPENPNQWKAAKKIASQIPKNCSWLIDFIEVFNSLMPDKVEPLPNPFETLSKPVTVSVTVTGTEINPTHTQGSEKEIHGISDDQQKPPIDQNAMAPNFDWIPNPKIWEAIAFKAGLTNPDYTDHLTEFICHYQNHAMQPESHWLGKLVSWIKRAKPKTGGQPNAENKSNRTSTADRKPSLVERVEANVRDRQQARNSRTVRDADGETVDQDGKLVRV